MKKKSILLINAIIIVLSLLGGYYYSYIYSPFSKDKLVNDNLYAYELTSGDDYIITTLLDGKYLYYLISHSKSEENKNGECTLSKYNLNASKNEYNYKFQCDGIGNAHIVKNKNNVELLLESTNVQYKFDDKLNLIKKYELNSNYESSLLYFGLFDDKTLVVSDNNIYIDNKLYDSVDIGCGSPSSIYYKNNVYVYFVNYDNDLSCLYNINNKITFHYESNSVKIFDGGLYYNLMNDYAITRNESGFEEKIMLTNSNEINDYHVSENGKYITTSEKSSIVRLYNIYDKRLVHAITLEYNENYFINELNVNKYVSFIRNENSKNILYIWDYDKSKYIGDKINTINNIDYKFDNINIINKLEKTYNIKIYAYEDSVRYFNDFYALPSTNDLVINERLKSLEKILENFTKEMFTKLKYSHHDGLKIYLTDKVAPSDLETQISSPAAYTSRIGNDYIIAANVNENDFENNIIHELMHVIDFNMYDLYTDNKISSFPFDNWDDYNPRGFNYEYSYVQETDSKYIEGSNQKVYFIDNYSKTYPIEDRARIFENLWGEEGTRIILDNPYLKKKATAIRNSIIKVYPSMKDSKMFEILN